MPNSKLISLIGFIKPKIKEENLMLFSTINMTKLEINNIVANYYNFTNTLNTRSIQNDYVLQTKTCIMKLALLVIKNIAEPKIFCLLIRKKHIINNWSFDWFQLWYSLVGDKNKNKGRSLLQLDQIFNLTLKTFKKILFKNFYKKTQKFILFFKQKIKKNFFSFFIKTLNFKIINTFNVFGAFFNLFDFFQKIIYFMCRQRNFFYQQVPLVKLRCIFNKTQKILVDNQMYKLAIRQLYFKMFFFKEKVCFDFCLRRYYQNFGYVRKLLLAFLFVKKILFCNFNLRQNEQLFMCLRKKLQIYNKKAIFPTTKAKKSYIDDFCFGLSNPRFGKTRLRHAEKKNKINISCKRNINNILIKLRNPQVAYFKNIFNKMMQSIKLVFNQEDFVIITSSFFTKIKKIVLKLASFVTFFLSKILWKSAKKQQTKISKKYLVNKYWIFIHKLARFHFFEKSKFKTKLKFTLHVI